MSLRALRPCSFLALAALAAGCGSSPTPPAPMYTAAQLNAYASPPPPEDGMGGGSSAGAAPMSTPEAPPALPPAARVRVIHASPDPTLATVAGYADNQSDPMMERLEYRAAWGYHNFAPGEHRLEVRPVPAGPTVSSVVTAQTPALESDHRYTLVVHGLTTGAARLAVAALEDTGEAPAEGDRARVRFFHAIVGVGPVDVCVAGATPTARATPVFANVAYGAWGAAQGSERYAEVQGGRETRLQLRARAATACTGRVLGTAAVTPPERQVVTVVAVGRATGRAVARELLVCSDDAQAGAATCTPVPVQAPAAAPAAATGGAARPAGATP